MKQKTRNLFVAALALILLLSGNCSAETYQYDVVGRLTKVVYDNGSSIIYTYDLNSNILTQEVTGQDLDFDGFPDTTDSFPNDISASLDTDGDGYPDGWNAGYGQGDSTTGLTLDGCLSSPPIHLVGGGNYSQGLQWVYDLSAQSPFTIQAHSYLRDGPLLLDENKDVSFKGGYNCDFSNNSSSPSTIESLTIDGTSGPVTIDNIEIR